MKIEIRGMVETSLLDWDGMIVSTLYTPYCNFRCPYCQNSSLIFNPEKYPLMPFKVISSHLQRHKGWIDGICLTGGEPTLFEDLLEFIKESRSLGFRVKLDTNGTNPEVLKVALEEKLISYIAMDIKAPLNLKAYQESTGIKNEDLLKRVEESIKIIMGSSIDYEFRTTVVPNLHKREDIEEIARYIRGAKRYILQNFVPQETLDPEYLKIKPYPLEVLKEFCRSASSYVEKCTERGK